jgi:hypothetical protein
MASSSNNEVVGNSPEHVGVASAIERLKSLHDGDSAFSQVVSFGIEAVPALRTLLLQREPSGLYLVRCRVVEALAALKCHPAHRSSAARARNKFAHAPQRARFVARYRRNSKGVAAPAAADARRRPSDRDTCLRGVPSRGHNSGSTKRPRSSCSSKASRRLAPTPADR